MRAANFDRFKDWVVGVYEGVKVHHGIVLGTFDYQLTARRQVCPETGVAQASSVVVWPIQVCIGRFGNLPAIFSLAQLGPYSW